MRKNDGWMNALVAMLLIVFPMLVGFYFLLPDWTDRWVISYGLMWAVAVAFVVYVALLSFVFIWFKFLTIDSLAFNIPITIVMLGIFLTPNMVLWGRGLIVLLLIMTAIPANMLVTRIKDEIIYRNKKSAS